MMRSSALLAMLGLLACVLLLSASTAFAADRRFLLSAQADAKSGSKGSVKGKGYGSLSIGSSAKSSASKKGDKTTAKAESDSKVDKDVQNQKKGGLITTFSDSKAVTKTKQGKVKSKSAAEKTGPGSASTNSNAKADIIEVKPGKFTFDGSADADESGKGKGKTSSKVEAEGKNFAGSLSKNKKDAAAAGNAAKAATQGAAASKDSKSKSKSKLGITLDVNQGVVGKESEAASRAMVDFDSEAKGNQGSAVASAAKLFTESFSDQMGQPGQEAEGKAFTELAFDSAATSDGLGDVGSSTAGSLRTGSTTSAELKTYPDKKSIGGASVDFDIDAATSGSSQAGQAGSFSGDATANGDAKVGMGFGDSKSTNMVIVSGATAGENNDAGTVTTIFGADAGGTAAGSTAFGMTNGLNMAMGSASGGTDGMTTSTNANLASRGMGFGYLLGQGAGTVSTNMFSLDQTSSGSGEGSSDVMSSFETESGITQGAGLGTATTDDAFVSLKGENEAFGMYADTVDMVGGRAYTGVVGGDLEDVAVGQSQSEAMISGDGKTMARTYKGEAKSDTDFDIAAASELFMGAPGTAPENIESGSQTKADFTANSKGGASMTTGAINAATDSESLGVAAFLMSEKDDYSKAELFASIAGAADADSSAMISAAGVGKQSGVAITDVSTDAETAIETTMSADSLEVSSSGEAGAEGDVSATGELTATSSKLESSLMEMAFEGGTGKLETKDETVTGIAAGDSSGKTTASVSSATSGAGESGSTGSVDSSGDATSEATLSSMSIETTFSMGSNADIENTGDGAVAASIFANGETEGASAMSVNGNPEAAVYEQSEKIGLNVGAAGKDSSAFIGGGVEAMGSATPTMSSADGNADGFGDFYGPAGTTASFDDESYTNSAVLGDGDSGPFVEIYDGKLEGGFSRSGALDFGSQLAFGGASADDRDKSINLEGTALGFGVAAGGALAGGIYDDEASGAATVGRASGFGYADNVFEKEPVKGEDGSADVVALNNQFTGGLAFGPYAGFNADAKGDADANSASGEKDSGAYGLEVDAFGKGEIGLDAYAMGYEDSIFAKAEGKGVGTGSASFDPFGSDFSATGYTNAFTQNTPFWFTWGE